MPEFTDEQITDLYREKLLLIKKIDRHEINEEEGYLLVEQLENKIKQRTNEYISNLSLGNQETINKQELEDVIMPEEKKVKEVVIKEEKVRKERVNTYASLVIEALQKKSIRTIDAVVAYALEKKPGREPKSLKAQVITMISEIKKGKKPKFTWDEDNFLLIPKQ